MQACLQQVIWIYLYLAFSQSEMQRSVIELAWRILPDTAFSRSEMERSVIEPAWRILPDTAFSQSEMQRSVIEPTWRVLPDTRLPDRPIIRPAQTKSTRNRSHSFPDAACPPYPDTTLQVFPVSGAPAEVSRHSRRFRATLPRLRNTL